MRRIVLACSLLTMSFEILGMPAEETKEPLGISGMEGEKKEKEVVDQFVKYFSELNIAGKLLGPQKSLYTKLKVLIPSLQELTKSANDATYRAALNKRAAGGKISIILGFISAMNNSVTEVNELVTKLSSSDVPLNESQRKEYEYSKEDCIRDIIGKFSTVVTYSADIVNSSEYDEIDRDFCRQLVKTMMPTLKLLPEFMNKMSSKDQEYLNEVTEKLEKRRKAEEQLKANYIAKYQKERAKKEESVARTSTSVAAPQQALILGAVPGQDSWTMPDKGEPQWASSSYQRHFIDSSMTKKGIQIAKQFGGTAEVGNFNDQKYLEDFAKGHLDTFDRIINDHCTISLAADPRMWLCLCKTLKVGGEMYISKDLYIAKSELEKMKEDGFEIRKITYKQKEGTGEYDPVKGKIPFLDREAYDDKSESQLSDVDDPVATATNDLLANDPFESKRYRTLYEWTIIKKKKA